MFSTNEEYGNKSKQYNTYFIGRGHKLNNFEKFFNDILNMSDSKLALRNRKKQTVKNRIVFCCNYNPLGKNIQIIKKHANILYNCQIIQNK